MEKLKTARKTYSIAADRSAELAQCSLDLSKELGGRTVPKQAILDALVGCLKDKSVFIKVRNILKNL
jgi:hypothetical protein